MQGYCGARASLSTFITSTVSSAPTPNPYICRSQAQSTTPIATPTEVKILKGMGKSSDKKSKRSSGNSSIVGVKFVESGLAAENCGNDAKSRRSRLHQQAESEDLQIKVEKFCYEIKHLRKNIRRLADECFHIDVENKLIQKELELFYGEDVFSAPFNDQVENSPTMVLKLDSIGDRKNKKRCRSRESSSYSDENEDLYYCSEDLEADLN